jgi:hypothetical protein
MVPKTTETTVPPEESCDESSVRNLRDDQVDDFFVAVTVKQARSGGIDDAREILADFAAVVGRHSAASWSGPLHWDYARYIADAFVEILNEKDAALALGIKSSKAGRRRGITTYDTKALGAAYWSLIRRGYQSEHAISLLQNTIGADRRTIQRASAAARDRGCADPQQVPNFLLELDMGPYAAKIEEILAADR